MGVVRARALGSEVGKGAMAPPHYTHGPIWHWGWCDPVARWSLVSQFLLFLPLLVHFVLIVPLTLYIVLYECCQKDNEELNAV